MPATIPTTAPLTSFVTFSVISALASAISSRTSSCAFSVTSWTAWASSEVWRSAISVEQSLEDAGEHEGAGEGNADLHLRPLRGGQRLAGHGAVGRGLRDGLLDVGLRLLAGARGLLLGALGALAGLLLALGALLLLLARGLDLL